MSLNRTQPITPTDIRARRIRIPVDCKAIFPDERVQISINLVGTPLRVAYDPRLGPGRQRSGVLYVGSILEGLARPNEVLHADKRRDGIALYRPVHGKESQSDAPAEQNRPRAYRADIHARLIRVAIDGGTVTYSDLSKARGWIGSWLYRIAHEEDSAGRPPLTAIVVRKGRKGAEHPSYGFSKAMQEVGYAGRGEPEDEVWERALGDVYAYWRPKLNDDPTSWPRFLPEATESR